MLVTNSEKFRDVLRIAEGLYEQQPDWVTFFREVLGIDGLVRKAFPTPEELAEFEKSPECDEIQKLLVKLRERRGTADSETEPTRVITVRLPKSMHEYLRSEADSKQTSMNKLCISKLLQVIEDDKVPTEKVSNPRRKRKGVSATLDSLPAENRISADSRVPAENRISVEVPTSPANDAVASRLA